MALQIHRKHTQGVIVRQQTWRSSAFRKVRKYLIAAIMLIGLLGGGAYAYAWYAGQQGPEQPLPEAPVASSAGSFPKAPEVDKKAKVGVAIQILSSPVAPGDNASISVRTKPFAKCTIKVKYNKKVSKDSGLVPKAADDFGIVDWSWTLKDSTPLGVWPVEVTCVDGKQSGFVRGDQQVKLPEEE